MIYEFTFDWIITYIKQIKKYNHNETHNDY